MTILVSVLSIRAARLLKQVAWCSKEKLTRDLPQMRPLDGLGSLGELTDFAYIFLNPCIDAFSLKADPILLGIFCRAHLSLKGLKPAA